MPAKPYQLDWSPEAPKDLEEMHARLTYLIAHLEEMLAILFEAVDTLEQA